MFSDNKRLSDIMAADCEVGEFVFSDSAILGGAFTSTGSPFDCFIQILNCENLSGNRWDGDEYGIIKYRSIDEIEVSVFMESDEMLIVDIKAESIDPDSMIEYDEVDFSTSTGTGIANFKPEEQVYRLITSKANHPAAFRKVVLRLKDKDLNNPSPQSDWTIEFIKIWKVVVS